jgi:RNA recognition motif-containing protein
MNNKIYMGNLPFSYKEQELTEVFSKYGNIEDVFLVRDRNTKRLKGFGFITFDTAEAAQAALEMDNQELGGRVIKVAMAKEKQSADRDR